MTCRRLSNKLALVIDDHACVRTLLRIALKCDGLRVVEAGSGDEAAMKAEHLHPDLILTDLEMPTGGFDNIKRLRSLCRTSLIVVLSGREATAARAQSLASGGDLFLEKPFHLAELRVAVTTLMSAPGEVLGERPRAAVFVDSL